MVSKIKLENQHAQTVQLSTQGTCVPRISTNKKLDEEVPG